jgi:integrase/recombinase XerD
MFEQFIKERQYLQNVSPRTVEWYRESFKWLGEPQPNKAQLKSFVIRMREKGLKASSCNNRIRAVNAYLQWLESDLRIPKLKEEQRVLPTFSVENINTIQSWKPKTFCERRLHAIMLTLADTGTRIDEVLSLKWNEVDFDNLLLTVTGKGSKQRKIPFSFELRKILWRHYENSRNGAVITGRAVGQAVTNGHLHVCGQGRQGTSSHPQNTVPVFSTRQGRKLGRRDVLRDVKRTCHKLGVQPPERTLHSFRHTFAVNYLRRGGSVFHLQKCLGHSSLEMTRRYANLMTEDLQKIHQQVSLLSA